MNFVKNLSAFVVVFLIFVIAVSMIAGVFANATLLEFVLSILFGIFSVLGLLMLRKENRNFVRKMMNKN